MTACRHRHPDGRCHRFPPAFTSRRGATVCEWPEAPEGCVCGEWAPTEGEGQNPAPEAARTPQRGKETESKAAPKRPRARKAVEKEGE